MRRLPLEPPLTFLAPATELTADIQGDRAAALAAGGPLAMLTNSSMSFSFERGGSLAGAATAVGFCRSVLNS